MQIDSVLIRYRTTLLEHRDSGASQAARDELRVRLHLAKAEAKDEWARLEKQWEELRPKLEAAREEAGKTAESVGAR